MLGTVIATAVIATVIIIALLGVLFVMIFVVVKKLKTVHSGEGTNQNTARIRYTSTIIIVRHCLGGFYVI